MRRYRTGAEQRREQLLDSSWFMNQALSAPGRHNPCGRTTATCCPAGLLPCGRSVPARCRASHPKRLNLRGGRRCKSGAVMWEPKREGRGKESKSGHGVRPQWSGIEDLFSSALAPVAAWSNNSGFIKTLRRAPGRRPAARATRPPRRLRTGPSRCPGARSAPSSRRRRLRTSSGYFLRPRRLRSPKFDRTSSAAAPST